MLRRLSLAAVLAAFAVFAPTAGAATVVNGNFDAGLSGWTVTDLPGSAGTWYPYTGDQTPLAHGTVPAAFGTSAMVDMNEPNSTTMTQDVALEAGHSHTLTYKYWFESDAVWTVPNPLHFNLEAGANQNFRYDVIKQSASPFTTEPSDVLTTGVTVPADLSLTSGGWQSLSIDLSAHAGSTVKLRFLNVNNLGPLFTGLDDVAITSVDLAPPAVSAVTAPKSIVNSGKGAGGSFSLTTSEAGSLTIKFTKSSKGKKKGKKCVKPSKKLAKKKNCTRWVAVKGSITQPVVAGQNTIAFNGKLGGKTLKPGKYRLTFTVTDASGKASTPVTKTLTVKAPKKK